MHAPHSAEDLYSLLGVGLDASRTEITRAYRKLAMTWHPDRNGSRDAEETFKRIRLAYEVLRDPRRRADYDRSARYQAFRSGWSARAEPPRQDPQPEPPPRRSPEPRPESAGGGGRAGNLGRRLAISLQEQVQGCRAKLRVTRTEFCRTCDGSGRLESAPTTCRWCRGSGKVRRASLPFFLFGSEEVDCTDCGGRGVIYPECPDCQGTGSGPTKKGYLRFDIAAGVRPDATIRVRGFGRSGRQGGTSGDLLVRVSFAPDPLFEPDFPHLRCEMPISAFRLLAGGQIEVPTLDGTIELPLPEDGADGSVLRIEGQGLLDGATGVRGDLLVTLRVLRPDRLTEEQRKLLAELERSFAEHTETGKPFSDWQERLQEARRRQGRGVRREA
ncbi:MAG: DnaJ C-terminal domain-containing protein [Rhodocyclaceae bacterium]